MLFRNVTTTVLEAAATAASVRLIGCTPVGRATRATLGLLPDADNPARFPEWQRRSATPARRKVAAVCWHGHAVFFCHLFLLAPDAVVTGGRERTFAYKGALDFLVKYYDTGEWNIGSPAHPVAYSDACECRDTVMFDEVFPLTDQLWDKQPGRGMRPVGG